MQGINHQNMSETNRFMVLKTIAVQGPISRIALSKETKLSKMTVTSLIQDFLRQGIVRECGLSESTAGRKPTLLEVVPESLLTLGIMVGRDYLKVGVIDLKGNILLSDQVAIATIPTSTAFIQNLYALCDSILLNTNTDNIWGIGISSIGPIDLKEGTILNPPNFPWEKIQIVEALERKYSYPIYIENNMAVSALAEMYFGGGKNIDHFIYLGMTTGIGSGIILNKKLFSGSNGLSGIVGHMVVEADGLPCQCGQKGCLESYCSIPATVAWARQHGPNPQLTWPELLYQCREGDPFSLEVLNRMCRYICIALVNMTNLLDPQCIFIGGKFWFAADLVLEQLNKCLNEQMFAADYRKPVPIKKSLCQGNAAFIGTAALLMENNMEYRR